MQKDQITLKNFIEDKKLNINKNFFDSKIILESKKFLFIIIIIIIIIFEQN